MWTQLLQSGSGYSLFWQLEILNELLQNLSLHSCGSGEEEMSQTKKLLKMGMGGWYLQSWSPRALGVMEKRDKILSLYKVPS